MPKCPICNEEIHYLEEMAMEYVTFKWEWTGDKLEMISYTAGDLIDDSGGVFECPICGHEIGDLIDVTKFFRGDEDE